MEIKTYLNNLDPYQAKLEKSESAKAKDSRRGTETKGESGDRVSVSDEARLRTEAYRTALNAPEVRQEKVTALKAQVDAGEYQIDSQKVAEKLIREESEIFQ